MTLPGDAGRPENNRAEDMSNQTQSSKDGQGLVEYALILVLVAIVVILILALMGPQVGNVFSQVVEELNPSVASPGPPECYGSGLLAVMVAAMGGMLALSQFDLARRSRYLVKIFTQR